MLIYLVIRETRWKIPCSYGDYGEYYETETDVVSAHKDVDNAIKVIRTETAFETDEDVRYYWEAIELS